MFIQRQVSLNSLSNKHVFLTYSPVSMSRIADMVWLIPRGKKIFPACLPPPPPPDLFHLEAGPGTDKMNRQHLVEPHYLLCTLEINSPQPFALTSLGSLPPGEQPKQGNMTRFSNDAGPGSVTAASLKHCGNPGVTISLNRLSRIWLWHIGVLPSSSYHLPDALQQALLP